jgi:PAS domain S-box-containing protein
VQTAIDEATASGRSVSRPLSDGTRYVHVAVAPDRQFVTICGATEDQERLRELNARLYWCHEVFHAAQELSLDEFTVLKAVRDDAGAIVDFHCEYANPETGRILGVDHLELAGTRLLAQLPGLSRAGLFRRFVEVVRTGEPYDIEVRYDADGIHGWFRHMVVRLGDGLAIFFSDVTGRKLAEEALRQSEEHLRVLSESVPDVLLLATAEGSCIHVNRQFLKLTGRPVETARGTGWLDALHTDDAGRDRLRWAEALASGSGFESEHRFASPDGTYRWCITRFRPIHGDDGTISRWVGTITDIDALHQISDERMRLLAALEELTANLESRVTERTRQVRALGSALNLAEQHERQRISRILHDDLQQMLFGLRLQVQMLSLDMPPDPGEALAVRLHHIESLVLKAIDRTRSLSVDLNPPILNESGLPDALAWLGANMLDVHGLHLSLQVSDPMPDLQEDERAILFQIARELLFNVVKHAGVKQATIRLSSEGGRATLIVEDAGVGFDVPGVSSKSKTTLGLTSIRQRVQLTGGDMAIQSGPVGGTRVSVTIPVHAP